MHSLFTLVGLLIVASVALVAPVGAGVALHHGQAFHPVFAHEHPAGSAESELVQPTARPIGEAEYQGPSPVGAFVPLAIDGQTVPLQTLLSLALILAGSLSLPATLPRAGLSIRPLSPPPRRSIR